MYGKKPPATIPVAGGFYVAHMHYYLRIIPIPRWHHHLLGHLHCLLSP